jgi:hypothetical protein
LLCSSSCTRAAHKPYQQQQNPHNIVR